MMGRPHVEHEASLLAAATCRSYSLDLPHKCGSLRLWFASPVTRFPGGLGRPHQMDVDQDGNVYVASWEGVWMNKFVPKPGADPIKLVGRGLVLSE